jgi:transcription antitermination factor NusG
VWTGFGELNWLVVCTNLSAEAQACRNLEEKGFVTYYPKFKDRKGNTRRLFPNYVFATFSPIEYPDDYWKCIFRTVGVRRLIMNGGKPSWLPELELDKIRGQRDEKGFVKLPKREARWDHGTKVDVVEGPFQYCWGLYLGMNAKQREEVLINILGAQRVVEFANEKALALAVS